MCLSHYCPELDVLLFLAAAGVILIVAGVSIYRDNKRYHAQLAKARQESQRRYRGR